MPSLDKDTDRKTARSSVDAIWQRSSSLKRIDVICPPEMQKIRKGGIMRGNSKLAKQFPLDLLHLISASVYAWVHILIIELVINKDAE